MAKSRKGWWGRAVLPKANKRMFGSPEKRFQKHIADYLVREHG
jgi:hypothetical protein